jgi:hypothetical protein
MAQNLKAGQRGHSVKAEPVDVLIEEYRALYSVLVFRLGAMEQRVPATAAFLSAALGGTTLLPESVRPMVLIALPLVLVGFFRSTLGHARSKHDVKLRIDEIERHINRLFGQRLITFQSQHPSRDGQVAGRSGRESVLSVYFSVLALLAGSTFTVATSEVASARIDGYIVYTALCGLWVSIDLIRLGRYRRQHQLVMSGQQDSAG